MKVVAVLTAPDRASPGDFETLRVEEVRRVWALVGDGRIRAIHYRADRLGVVIELEVADAAEADAIVQALPMVRAGLLLADCIPLRPFTGLEALFAPEFRR